MYKPISGSTHVIHVKEHTCTTDHTSIGNMLLYKSYYTEEMERVRNELTNN